MKQIEKTKWEWEKLNTVAEWVWETKAVESNSGVLIYKHALIPTWSYRGFKGWVTHEGSKMTV